MGRQRSQQEAGRPLVLEEDEDDGIFGKPRVEEIHREKKKEEEDVK